MQSSIHTLSCGTILHGHSYNYQIKGVLGHGAFGITYLASICLKGELGILNSNVSVAIKEFFLQDVVPEVHQEIFMSHLPIALHTSMERNLKKRP